MNTRTSKQTHSATLIYGNQLYTPKSNCEHAYTLELPSGIISPYMLKMQFRFNTFKSLYLKWKRLNGH